MSYKLFVFEGPDGSGKTHAVEEMKIRLIKSGFNTHIIRLPSPEGILYSVIRAILKDKKYIDEIFDSEDLKREVFYYMTKYGYDLNEFKTKKESLLQTLMMINMKDVINDEALSKFGDGSIILLDRSFISTIVYGIKNGNPMFMKYKSSNGKIDLNYNWIEIDKLYYFNIGIDLLLKHASRRQKLEDCEENDKTDSVLETHNLYNIIINKISDQSKVMRVCDDLLYEGNEVTLYKLIYEKIHSDIIEICKETDE